MRSLGEELAGAEHSIVAEMIRNSPKIVLREREVIVRGVLFVIWVIYSDSWRTKV